MSREEQLQHQLQRMVDFVDTELMPRYCELVNATLGGPSVLENSVVGLLTEARTLLSQPEPSDGPPNSERKCGHKYPLLNQDCLDCAGDFSIQPEPNVAPLPFARPDLEWKLVDYLRVNYPSYGAGETLSMPATKDVVHAIMQCLDAIQPSVKDSPLAAPAEMTAEQKLRDAITKALKQMDHDRKGDCNSACYHDCPKCILLAAAKGGK